MSEQSERMLRARLADLEAERALLVTRTENAEAALAYAASTGDECAIEVAALRKDAERYRYLRDATGWSIQQWLGLSGVWTEYLSGKLLDDSIDDEELFALAADEIERLRLRVSELERRCDWMLHNGGTWCDEWPKEWRPGKHGPLIPWLSARIDAALTEPPK